MKRVVKKLGLGLGAILAVLTGMLFASRAESASPALKAINSCLYNQSLAPITYVGYQQRLSAGMPVAEIQTKLQGKGNLFGGKNSVSSAQITSPLGPHFTGYLKLHDVCCGNFGDCGSTWLVMEFAQGKLKTSRLWFNTF